MSLVLIVLGRLLPLYAIMGAGFLSARASGDISKGLAMLQIYLVGPIVITTNVMKLDFTPDMLALPIVFFLISAVMASLCFYAFRSWGNGMNSLIAQGGGGMNTGYLGVPVALAVFGPEALPLYLFAMMGGPVYESSVGYYWIARAHFSVRQALIKLLKLPTLYACALGLVLGAYDIVLPPGLEALARDFLGAYIVLGALMIGMGLAQNRTLDMDWAYTGVALAIKFVVWPLAMLGIVVFDRMVTTLLPPTGSEILLFMSILPMAANTVAFASLLNVYPAKAAFAVALSTLLGLAVIPFYVGIWGLGNF